jgi:hypothetical protein
MAFGNIAVYGSTVEVKRVSNSHICCYIGSEIVLGMDPAEALDVGEKLVALARLCLTGGRDVVE